MDSQQQLQIPDDIRTFLDGLLQDAGMTTLDAEMKEEMIKELFARLDNFMTSSIIENMPPEHLDAFIKMNEEEKPKQEVEQFLKEKIPNAQEVFAKVFMDFREMYLGNVTVARNAPEKNSQNQKNPEDQNQASSVQNNIGGSTTLEDIVSGKTVN